jgi:hypothetical protein
MEVEPIQRFDRRQLRRIFSLERAARAVKHDANDVRLIRMLQSSPRRRVGQLANRPRYDRLVPHRTGDGGERQF